MATEAANAPIALITGANRGIGLEVARRLGAAGYIVILGVRDLKQGEAACSELRAGGAQAELEQLDVNDPASIEAAAGRIDQRHGRLDVLINNAGVLLEWVLDQTKPPEETAPTPPSQVDIEVVRGTFLTNTLGPIAMTTAFLPLLRRSAAASIVNVSSSLASLSRADHACKGGEDSYLNLLAYNVSKAALNAATLQFAFELRATAIKVNAVDPGHCATAINGFTGDRSAADAAELIVEVATRGPDGPTGHFIGYEPLSW